jgi:integrase
VIHVRRSWDDDPEVGEIDVKSDAGRRRVPVVGTLRDAIVGHGLLVPRAGADLVFGRTAELPFIPSTTRRRALKAWKAANNALAQRAQEGGRDVRPEEILRPLTPHDARHCAASYLIAAGLNPKQLSVYIGHSDIRTTYNRYGHLMPGDEVQAAVQIDAFLGAASGGKSLESTRPEP